MRNPHQPEGLKGLAPRYERVSYEPKDDSAPHLVHDRHAMCGGPDEPSNVIASSYDKEHADRIVAALNATSLEDALGKALEELWGAYDRNMGLPCNEQRALATKVSSALEAWKVGR